jgi:hypothetical protein
LPVAWRKARVRPHAGAEAAGVRHHIDALTLALLDLRRQDAAGRAVTVWGLPRPAGTATMLREFCTAGPIRLEQQWPSI